MKTARANGSRVTAPIYRHPLLQSISPCLASLAGLRDPVAKRQVRWTPQAAATAAVLMSWNESHALSGRCEEALCCMASDFTRGRRVGRTYNGLMKALQRQSATVLPLRKTDLRRQVLGALAQVPPTAGWTLLAVDGSKANLPRTQDQETCFGIADNGACPQAFVTAVVEVHTKLLWDWRIDKATASEKTHLVEMAAGLPPSALLLADGNFVGYRIWSTLHHQQQPFLIRVGGNVHLLTQLWPEARIERRGDIVYAWPGQRQNKEAPLRLRLLKVGGASQPVYLLTNILDPRRLSRRSAGKIYRLRWGAELFYRAFKQTLGFTKLRSRSGGRGKIELEWALIACAVMTLLGINARRRADPRRLSPAGLLHTLRRSLLHGQPGSIRRLQRALAHCLRDCYQRHAPKASRHRPITRNTPKPLQLQAPNLRPATSHERKIAHETYPDLAA